MIFPSHFDLVEEVLLGMVQKPMNLHVYLNFKFGGIVFVGFDLRMSRGGVDTFALVIKHLNDSWTFMHSKLDYLRCMIPLGFPWLGSWNLCLESMI